MNAEPQSILDVLNRINGGDLAALVAAFMVMVFAAIMVIAMIIMQMHKNRLNDALKRDLVERGFSPDEIARIVESSPPSRSLREKLRGRIPTKETSHVRT